VTTPNEEVLKNVISHTHCVEKIEDGDSLISKFVYEHRFCDNVKIGEISKEEDMTITYMPSFILHLPDKKDCSTANIHLEHWTLCYQCPGNAYDYWLPHLHSEGFYRGNDA
jgi:hypothetical protein